MRVVVAAFDEKSKAEWADLQLTGGEWDLQRQ
jgi:hypothetical protein